MAAATIACAGAARNLAPKALPRRAPSLSVSASPRRRWQHRIAILAAFGGALSALVCAAGLGAGVAGMLTAASALLQGQTPAPMRGRVSSAALAMMASAQALALVTGGWAAGFGLDPGVLDVRSFAFRCCSAWSEGTCA